MRYRLYYRGLPRFNDAPPDCCSDLLRKLYAGVCYSETYHKDEWIVLDSYKSFQAVPRETVLRVCGLS